MRSQFDSPMRIEDGVAQACGELGWEAGETQAHVAITISQKDEKLVGSASSPPDFEPPEEEWMFSVRPSAANRKFKKGPAHAVGVIHTTTDGGVTSHQWEQDIELDPDAVDNT